MMMNQKNLLELKEGMKSIKEWRSVPANVVMADQSGNIGYMLLASSPLRKGDYPYLGCRVLDGTSSKHDWEGIVDLKSLPFVLNPKKGYYMTANQRIVPENSKFDIGATMISTPRAIRLNELLS